MPRADGTPRPPPRGRLFQEDLRGEPFWMLVACSLVNLTTWEQAEPAFRWMRERYGADGWVGLAASPPEDLHDALRPLGLWRRRAASLVEFARSWLAAAPRRAKDVLAMPGCGRYAHDSWAIFVDGRTDVEPRDGKLVWYAAQLREGRNAGSAGGQGACGAAAARAGAVYAPQGVAVQRGGDGDRPAG